MNIFGNPILGSLLAITFIYAMLSILVSILNEWLSSKLKTRSKMLKSSIQDLLYDPANAYLSSVFFDHHMIQGLSEKERKKTIEYISSDLFADVLIDVIINRNQSTVELKKIEKDGKVVFELKKTEKKTNNEPQGDHKDTQLMEVVKSGIDAMNTGTLKDLLTSFHLKSSNDYQSFVNQIKTWYDEYQDRVTGWYRAKQKKTLLAIGFVVAIGLNVDSIHLFTVINKNDALRDQLELAAFAAADEYKKQIQENGKSKNAQDFLNVFKKLGDSTAKDSTILKIQKEAEKYVELNDADKQMFQQTSETLGLIAQYNLPIGWNKEEPPVLWWNNYFGKQDESIDQDNIPKHHVITAKESEKKITKSEEEKKRNTLEAYLVKRNEGKGWNIPLYLAGIIITGFSLSFGAPFWFDVLMKLVNLRRAGKNTGESRKK